MGSVVAASDFARRRFRCRALSFSQWMRSARTPMAWDAAATRRCTFDHKSPAQVGAPAGKIDAKTSEDHHGLVVTARRQALRSGGRSNRSRSSRARWSSL